MSDLSVTRQRNMFWQNMKSEACKIDGGKTQKNNVHVNLSPIRLDTTKLADAETSYSYIHISILFFKATPLNT